VKAVKQTLVDKKQEGRTEGTVMMKREVAAQKDFDIDDGNYLYIHCKSFGTNYRYY
jgi:hypothetical protein